MSLRLRSGTALLIIKQFNNPIISFTVHLLPFPQKNHQPKPIIRQLKQGIGQLVAKTPPISPEFAGIFNQ